MRTLKVSVNKKCACQGGTLDRFIQPSILLILTWGESNGYMIIKQMRELSMFQEGLPDATGVYTVYNMTGAKLTELYLYEVGAEDKGTNYAADGIKNQKKVVLTYEAAADAT